MAGAVAEIDARGLGDRARFADEVLAAERPVVLRGLGAHWPLVEAAARSTDAAYDYLRSLDRGAQAQAFIGDRAIGGRYSYGEQSDGFNFAREMMTVSEVLSRIAAAAADEATPSAYMGSIPAEHFLPGFSAANAVPLLPATVEPRIWLGSASNVSCHYDTFENIACVAVGRRRFTLYPPDAIGDIYVGPIDHTMAGQPIGLAVGSAPGDPRYPRFDAAARARARVAELGPGDALYLPKLWWHQVEGLAPFNVLVNYWWDAFAAGPDAPYTALLLSLITIAERPPAERAAWRAFFDHYVFRPDGHPLAHLPEEKHGILGVLRAGNYGKIRAHVMRMLRG